MVLRELPSLQVAILTVALLALAPRPALSAEDVETAIASICSRAQQADDADLDWLEREYYRILLSSVTAQETVRKTEGARIDAHRAIISFDAQVFSEVRKLAMEARRKWQVANDNWWSVSRQQIVEDKSSPATSNSPIGFGNREYVQLKEKQRTHWAEFMRLQDVSLNRIASAAEVGRTDERQQLFAAHEEAPMPLLDCINQARANLTEEVPPFFWCRCYWKDGHTQSVLVPDKFTKTYRQDSMPAGHACDNSLGLFKSCKKCSASSTATTCFSFD